MKKLDRITPLRNRMERIITSVGAGLFFFCLIVIPTIHIYFARGLDVAPTVAILTPIFYATFADIRKKS